MTDDPDFAHAVPAARVLRRARGRWRLVAFVALAVAVLALAGRFALPGSGNSDHVARIVIDGVIATDPGRLDAIEAMIEDDAVKAVIVAINSPGGTTAGGEELYDALSRLREVKPVVATIAELGASAAYMTAISANRIFTRRLSIVGSIGVYYSHVDAGKLLDTIGVDFDKVQTGPLKAEPDLDDPMTGAVRQSLQRLVDDSYEWFVDIVAERRGIERDTVLELADGRILTGRQAVAAALADAFGGEREAIVWLEQQWNIGEGLPVFTHYPPAEDGLAQLLRYAGGQALSLVGLGGGSTNALDGLVSLWQAENLVD
ncbi:MAG: signal peptide peptidase SppA [Alphaproteobacteria bacterium]|nr:signal peptide peptidase SppA [Alphaproteobacteria bacterium]